jgi:uncharacterized protein YdeI (YjbR/CyaY-like superfamily)
MTTTRRSSAKRRAREATSPSTRTAPTRDGEPILSVPNVAAWDAWLRENHAQSRGVLLKIPKKRTASTLTYATALDAALAWGWIDSQKQALDDTAWLQRFTPRTARSPWSKINRSKAEALIARGRMEPPGLAQVERARNDGRWARAYDSARTSIVPLDLAEALAKNARARAFFDGLDSANRYAILYRVNTAKRPETRARRIAEFVAMCAAHKTLHPPRRKAAKGNQVLGKLKTPARTRT